MNPFIKGNFLFSTVQPIIRYLAEDQSTTMEVAFTHENLWVRREASSDALEGTRSFTIDTTSFLNELNRNLGEYSAWWRFYDTALGRTGPRGGRPLRHRIDIGAELPIALLLVRSGIVPRSKKALRKFNELVQIQREWLQADRAADGSQRSIAQRLRGFVASLPEILRLRPFEDLLARCGRFTRPPIPEAFPDPIAFQVLYPAHNVDYEAFLSNISNFLLNEDRLNGINPLIPIFNASDFVALGHEIEYCAMPAPAHRYLNIEYYLVINTATREILAGIGFVVFSKKARRPWLTYLATVQDKDTRALLAKMRCPSLVKKLTGFVERRLYRRGYRRLYVWTTANNFRAVNSYRNYGGYTPTTARSPDMIGVANVVAFQKALNPFDEQDHADDIARFCI
jgi:hypothetical protein